MPRFRQHRRAVLWIAAGFALVQIGLAIAVDSWLPQVRDPEYAVRETRLRERLAELPDRPLTLVLGTSRTVNGLMAGSLSGTASDDRPIVFNFGLPGAGPFMQRVCFERLRAAGIKPDTLIVEVLPAFFNQQRSECLDQIMLDGARLAADELALLAPYADRPVKPLARWTHGRLLPAQRHQAELRDAVGLDQYRPGHGPLAPDASMDGHGWQPWAEEPTPDLRQAWTALAHRQYDDCYRSFRRADGSIRALKDILLRCRRDGIRAALVLMPEASEFRSLCTPEVSTALAGILDGLRPLCDWPIIDARDWVDDAGFTDGHHLHPGGALVFTEKFGPVLRSLSQ